MDSRVLRSARKLGFADYEDAVLHESARRGRADALVTRNPDDFEKATLTIYEPAELLAVIEAPQRLRMLAPIRALLFERLVLEFFPECSRASTLHRSTTPCVGGLSR